MMALAETPETSGVEFDVRQQGVLSPVSVIHLDAQTGHPLRQRIRSTTQQWAVLGALARPLVQDRHDRQGPD